MNGAEPAGQPGARTPAPDDTHSSAGYRRSRVTMVITCYNHAQLVEKALDSVLDQTRPPDQLIVTDDASADGSGEVIERWLAKNWPEATFVRHTTNRGLTPTLNEVISLVQGDSLALLSADDWMRPDRLAIQVPILEQHPEVSMVHSDVLVVDESGAVIGLGSTRLEAGPRDGDLYRLLLAGNVILTPSVLLRTSTLRSAGEYDESLFAEDYDMWLRLARLAEWAYVPEPLVFYRHHAHAATSRTGYLVAAREQELRILRKHLGQAVELDELVMRQIRGILVRLYLWGRSPAATARDLRDASPRGQGGVSTKYRLASTMRIPGPAVRKLTRLMRTGAPAEV